MSEFSLLCWFNPQVLWASNAPVPVIPPWLWQDPGEIYPHQRPADCQRHGLHSQDKGTVLFPGCVYSICVVAKGHLEIVGFLFFRVLVRFPKTPSQPGVDAPSQAVVQSGPRLSPESRSTRPTGGCKYQPVKQCEHWIRPFEQRCSLHKLHNTSRKNIIHTVLTGL